ncbi:MAG: hypothetical protein ABWX73_08435 [Marmoricola sp.]
MEGTVEPGAVRRLAWAVAALVAVVVLVASLVIVVGVPRWVPGVGDCTVSAGDDRVELSTEQAEQAAVVAAVSVREKRSLAATTASMDLLLDSSAGDARIVASALMGRSPHALSCQHGGAAEEERDRLDRVGLTGRAATVRSDVNRAFGAQKLGGFAPGGVTSGHMPGSAHYEGRAVDVFFRPMTGKQRARGWAMAQYLVAHADRLAVSTVIFDGRIWTARRGIQGWRSYAPDTSGRSAKVAAILEHRDHVHVDVAD